MKNLSRIFVSVLAVLFLSYPLHVYAQDLFWDTSPAGSGSVSVSPAGPYVDGQTVSVTAVPASADYTFSGWGGAASGAAVTTNVLISGDTYVTAIFTYNPPLAQYTLSVSAAPAAGGTVNGSGTYAEGRNAFVSAAPSAGYVFTGWSGPVNDTYAVSTYVEMWGNYSVTANFEPEPITQYTVNVSAAPAVGGSVSGGGTYDEGANATLTASPAAGYYFAGWTGDYTGTANPVNLTVYSNMNVTANFEAEQVPQYNLYVMSSGGGSASGDGTFNEFSYASITATPDPGYIFTGWSGDFTGTANPASVYMDANKVVTANFQLETVQYTLTMNAAAGGSSSPADGTHTYNEGDPVTISATPDNGYIFTGWSGSYSGSDNPATIYINSNMSITPVFALDGGGVTTFNLTVNAMAGGNVAPAPGTYTYNEGDSVSLSATPLAGYVFTGWSGDIGGTANPTSFNIYSNMSVTANFEAQAVQYTLTMNAGTGGTCSPAPGAYFYNSGDPVSITAIPDNGYKFTGWSGSYSGADNPATIYMDSNRSITPVFALDDGGGAAETVSVPYAASGPAAVETGISETYSSGGAVSSEGHSVQYSFDWGDGSSSGWAAAATASHSWMSAGTYSVVVYARCSEHTDIISAPSGNYQVVVSDAGGGVTSYTLAMSVSPAGSGSTDPAAGGTYNSGDTVYLSAYPAAGYVFDYWTVGAQVIYDQYTQITMDGNKTATANFKQGSTSSGVYTLNVSYDPAMGTVTKSPEKALYDINEVVTLTAAPYAGFSFDNWNGDPDKTATQLMVTMTGDMNVAANFYADNTVYYTVTTSSAPAIAGWVNRYPDKAQYADGESVQLVAAENAGYQFSHWSGDVSGTDYSVTLTVDKNLSVIANYIESSTGLAVTFEVQPAGGGWISVVPESGPYETGTVVEFTSHVNPGYMFLNWGGDLSGTAATKTFTLGTSNIHAIAYFEAEAAQANSLPDAFTNQNYYAALPLPDPSRSVSSITLQQGPGWLTLDAATESLGGMPAAADYGPGYTVSIYVSYEDGGSETLNFRIDVIDSAGGTSDETISAPSIVQGPDTVATGVMSYFSASGAVSSLGNDIEYMFFWGDGGSSSWTPSSANHAWMTAGTYVITVQARSINNPEIMSAVSGGKTVVVSETGAGGEGTLVLSSEVVPAGAGAVNPAYGTYNEGDVASLSAAPMADYVFSHWSGDIEGISDINAPSISFSMTTARHLIANFIFNDGAGGTTGNFNLAVTAIPAAGGTVSPAGGSYFDGEIVTLTATPAAGYVFDFWSGPVDAASMYTSSIRVTMDSDKVFTANFKMGAASGGIYSLMTMVEPAGAGFVTRNPERALYDDGEQVHLDAVPAQGYRFSHWSGDVTGYFPTLDLSMDSSKSLTAHFAEQYLYTVTTEAMPPEAGYVVKAPEKAEYELGEKIQLTAMVNEGWMFSHWSGDVSGTEPSISVYIFGGKHAIANYVSSTPQIMALPDAFVNRDYAQVMSLPDPVRIVSSRALMNAPAWMTFDSDTGMFGGFPGSIDSGSGFLVKVNVVYDDGGSQDIEYTLNVIDDGGGIVPGDETKLPPAMVNQQYEFYLPRETGSEIFTLVGGPGWLMFDAATVRLYGMPAAADAGENFTVTLNITDSEGSETKNLSIDVYDEGGTTEPMKLLEAYVGEAYVYTLPAPARPVSSRSLLEAPGWITFEPATGMISGTPAAIDIGNGLIVRIQVSYTDGGSEELYFMLDVFDVGSSGNEGRLPSAVANQQYEFYLPRESADDVFALVSGPGWLMLDIAQARFYGIPAAADTGTDFPVTVSRTSSSGTETKQLFIDVLAEGPGGEPPYILTVNFDPAMGSVTRDPDKAEYDADETVMLTVAPVPGFVFHGWSGDYTGTEPSVTIVMSRDMSITAAFMPEGSAPGEMELPPAMVNIEYAGVVPLPDPMRIATGYTKLDGPSWLVVETANGILSGMPAAADMGDDQIVKLQISYQDGGVEELTYTIDVYDNGTVPGDNALPAAYVNEEYAHTLPLPGPARTVRSLSIQEGPSWLTLNSASGMFSGMPAAADMGYGYIVRVKVEYEDGDSEDLSYMLDVIDKGAVPGEMELPPAMVNMEYAGVVPLPDPMRIATGYTKLDGPAWLVVETATGILSGMPAAADMGDDQIVKLQISYQDGGVEEITYTIDVYDDGGTGPEWPEQLPDAYVNQVYSHFLSKEDPDAVLKIVSGPSWLSLDSGTAEFRGTPAAADAGLAQMVKVAVTTSEDEQFEIIFYIDVLESGGAADMDVPVIVTEFLPEAVVLMSYSTTVLVSDADANDSHVFSLLEAPAWLQIEAGGRLYGTPAAADLADEIAVTVMVTDSKGLFDQRTFMLKVLSEGSVTSNTPPVIETAALPSAVTGEQYSAVISAYDNDINDKLTFTLESAPAWLKIDAETGRLSGAPATDDVGTAVSVVVSVVDSFGAVTQQTFTFAVNYPEPVDRNTAPAITTSSLPDAEVGEQYAATVRASDPDSGDALTFSLVSGPDWLSIDSASGVLSGLPGNNDVAASVSLSVRVTDSGGLVNERSYFIAVNMSEEPVIPGAAPVIVIQTLPSATAGVAYSASIRISDADTGDTHTFSMEGAPGWLSINAGTGALSGTPKTSDTGTLSIKVKVVDSSGHSVEKSFTLTVSAPEILEPDGSAPVIVTESLPSATAGVAYSTTIAISDEDANDTHAFGLLNAPSWLSINAQTGVLSGVPPEADAGDVTFTVTVVDSGAKRAERQFTLAISAPVIPIPAGTAPVIITESLPAAIAGKAYGVTVRVSDEDTNDTHTFEMQDAPPWLSINAQSGILAGVPLEADASETSITVKVTDSNGLMAERTFTLVVTINNAPEIVTESLPDAFVNIAYDALIEINDADTNDSHVFSLDENAGWLSIDPVTGTLSGTPVSVGPGSKTATVTVTDNGGKSAEKTFTITVIQAYSPVIATESLPAAIAGVAYEAKIEVNDADANDTHHFSLVDESGWFLLDEVSGVLSGTPGAGSDQVSVTVTVTDSFGISVDKTFVIAISENTPPEILTQKLPNASVGYAYKARITASVPDQGDSHVFAISAGPDWLIIDAVTGKLSGTPGEDDTGDVSVTVSVTDLPGQKDEVLLAFEVIVSDPPVIITESLPDAVSGTAYLVNIETEEPGENDTLSFAVEGPAWLSIDAATGVLYGTPAEDDVALDIAVKVIVSNSASLESELDTSIAVRLPNRAPKFVTESFFDAEQGVPYELTLVAEDVNEGDVLTYKFLIAPAWLKLSKTGEVTGTPGNGDVGEGIAVSVMVSDMAGLADTLTTTMSVIDVNDAPVFITKRLWDATEAVAYTDTLKAMDPDGDEFTFAMLEGPEWIVFDSGVLSGIPPYDETGDGFPMLFTVTDTAGLADTLDVNLHVVADVSIDHIEVTPDAALVMIGGSRQYTGIAYDTHGDPIESALVHWDVEGDIGTIDDDGVFMASAGGKGMIIASAMYRDTLVTGFIEVEVYQEEAAIPDIGDGGSVTIENLAFPLDFMNGLSLDIPEIDERGDVEIAVGLPPIADPDSETRGVTFAGPAISGVSFTVEVDGVPVSPYYFDEPVTISVPYNTLELASLGIAPEDLKLYYLDSSGNLTLEGIEETWVDELQHIVYARVAHFSDFAVASKFDGPTLLGDFDYNSTVDFYDFIQLIAYWNSSNKKGDIAGTPDGSAGSAPWYTDTYPFGPDGVVNFEDMTAFALMYNWDASGGTSAREVFAAKPADMPYSAALAADADELSVGENFTLALSSSAVSDLLGAGAELAFDSEKLAVSDVRIVNGGDSSESLSVYHRSEEGLLQIAAIALTGTSEGVSVPEGTLFEIDFDVIGSGTFSIELLSLDLRDMANTPLPVEYGLRRFGATAAVPREFALEGGYPNPFNMQTTIAFSLDREGRTSLLVYNTLGQLVRELVGETLRPGVHRVAWDGLDSDGRTVTSGVYIVKLMQNGRSETGKLLLLK